MVNVNGRAKLNEDEQMIVKQAWALETAQKMNILITESHIEDHHLYVNTSNGEKDVDAFMTLKDDTPYCHFAFSVNGVNIL